MSMELLSIQPKTSFEAFYQTMELEGTKNTGEKADAEKTKIATATSEPGVSLKQRAVSVLNGIGQVLAWPFKKIHQFFMWIFWACCKPSNMIERFAKNPERTANDFVNNPEKSFQRLLDSFIDQPEKTARAAIDLFKVFLQDDDEALVMECSFLKCLYALTMPSDKADPSKMMEVVLEKKRLKKELKLAKLKEDAPAIESITKQIDALVKREEKTFKMVKEFKKIKFSSLKDEFTDGISLSKRYIHATFVPDVLLDKAKKQKVTNVIEDAIARFKERNEDEIKANPLMNTLLDKFEKAVKHVVFDEPDSVVRFYKTVLLELFDGKALADLAMTKIGRAIAAEEYLNAKAYEI